LSSDEIVAVILKSLVV
jgi:hypothetical protein